MAFAPVVPIEHCPPERIGLDTWLIHQVQPALDGSLCVYLNSLVIAGTDWSWPARMSVPGGLLTKSPSPNRTSPDIDS